MSDSHHPGGSADGGVGVDGGRCALGLESGRLCAPRHTALRMMNIDSALALKNPDAQKPALTIFTDTDAKRVVVSEEVRVRFSRGTDLGLDLSLARVCPRGHTLEEHELQHTGTGTGGGGGGEGTHRICNECDGWITQTKKKKRAVKGTYHSCPDAECDYDLCKECVQRAPCEWRVDAVSGLAVSAGAQVGDVVIKVQGHSTKNLSLAQLKLHLP